MTTLEMPNLYGSVENVDGWGLGLSQPKYKDDHPTIEFIMLDRWHAEKLRDWLIETLGEK